MVERQLGEKVQVQVRGRTLEAEKARTERKAIYLDKPPEQSKPTKKTKKKEPARRAVPTSSTFAIPKASPSVSASKSTPLPASTLSSKVSPVHNSTPAASSSKTQQVAGPSKAASSPLPASTSSTASFGSEITGARARLVHCLALKPRTQEQVITMCAGKEPAPRTRNEIISILRAVSGSAPFSNLSSNRMRHRWRNRWLLHEAMTLIRRAGSSNSSRGAMCDLSDGPTSPPTNVQNSLTGPNGHSPSWVYQRQIRYGVTRKVPPVLAPLERRME